MANVTGWQLDAIECAACECGFNLCCFPVNFRGLMFNAHVSWNKVLQSTCAMFVWSFVRLLARSIPFFSSLSLFMHVHSFAFNLLFLYRCCLSLPFYKSFRLLSSFYSFFATIYLFRCRQCVRLVFPESNVLFFV